MEPSNSAAMRNGTAAYIAVVVRNALEDFRVKHLTDTQMAEVNPIIRHAVYDALQAVEKMDECEATKAIIDCSIRHASPGQGVPELPVC